VWRRKRPVAWRRRRRHGALAAVGVLVAEKLVNWEIEGIWRRKIRERESSAVGPMRCVVIREPEDRMSVCCILLLCSSLVDHQAG
jgi:hypothetical protein